MVPPGPTTEPTGPQEVPEPVVESSAKLRKSGSLRLVFPCSANGKVRVSYKGKRRGAGSFACTDHKAKVSVKL